MQAAQQLGAALGVGILVSVFAGSADDAGTSAEAFSAAAAHAFFAATALAVLTLVLVAVALREPARG